MLKYIKVRMIQHKLRTFSRDTPADFILLFNYFCRKGNFLEYITASNIIDEMLLELVQKDFLRDLSSDQMMLSTVFVVFCSVEKCFCMLEWLSSQQEVPLHQLLDNILVQSSIFHELGHLYSTLKRATHNTIMKHEVEEIRDTIMQLLRSIMRNQGLLRIMDDLFVLLSDEERFHVRSYLSHTFCDFIGTLYVIPTEESLLIENSEQWLLLWHKVKKTTNVEELLALASVDTCKLCDCSLRNGINLAFFDFCDHIFCFACISTDFEDDLESKCPECDTEVRAWMDLDSFLRFRQLVDSLPPPPPPARLLNRLNQAFFDALRSARDRTVAVFPFLMSKEVSGLLR